MGAGLRALTDAQEFEMSQSTSCCRAPPAGQRQLLPESGAKFLEVCFQ